MRIATTPHAERPRERCLAGGAQCLSLRECIAVILGSGPPQQGCLGLAAALLQQMGPGLSPEEEERSFFTAMEVSSHAYLNEISGLGPAGQARLLAAFELGRRYVFYRHAARLLPHPIHQEVGNFSFYASAALKQISSRQRSEPEEWLGFIPIHRSGEVGKFCRVEKGVRTHINIDPAELFARLLPLRPRGFVLAHNHPSGLLIPSEEDIDLTHKVAAMAHQFGILLLGHWLVTVEDQTWIGVSGSRMDSFECQS